MANNAFDNHERFMVLYFSFMDVKHISKEKQHFTLNALLDEFNSLNYKLSIIQDHSYGSQLISSVTKQVPSDDSFLAAKVSRLIVNLVHKQKIALLSEHIVPCVEWFIQVLKICSEIVLCDILEGLSAVLKGNGAALTKYHKCLIEPNGLLSSILKSTTKCDMKSTINCPFEVTLHVLKCYESLVNINEENLNKSSNDLWIAKTHLEYCGDIFLHYLYKSKSNTQDELNYSQVLFTCFSGALYIVQYSSEWCSSILGDLLGAVKVHIFHGLSIGENLIPQKVLPSQQPMPENLNNICRIGRGGKMIRTRKQRANNIKTSCAPGEVQTANESKIYSESTFSGTTANCSLIVTSESDISDSESNVGFRIVHSQCRVRQKALELLLIIIRAVSKHELFGYWHSLMPSNPSDNNRFLSASVINDPSPRCRIGALNILTAMLSGSRNYLWRADYCDKMVTAFTPFSVVLGGMISALHNALRTAISQEQSFPVIIQILKCCSALIQSTPYHRLENGLLVNLVCSIKSFVKHKDIAVQVAALIALGCAVSVQPCIPEFYEFISKPIDDDKLNKTYFGHEEKFKNEASNPSASPTMKSAIENITSSNKNLNNDNTFSEEEFEDEDLPEHDLGYANSTDNAKTPWLLLICLENLGVGKDAAPVQIRLESLNVLAAIGSSYFSLFENNLDVLSLAIETSLLDHHIENRMYGGKTLDALGYAMNSYLNNKDINKKLSPQQCYIFWQTLLNPLMGLVEDTQNSLLRSIACDCLGNIGNEVFKLFPRDKQIFVITNLFGCARDPEASVRAAAVRALAVCVEFPPLREDFGFLMDTADAIINLMKETNLPIRIKAYWSLGNLSDALVYAVTEQFEEISEPMLMTLLRIAIDGTKDNDRVKCNAMRAVGSLLWLLNSELIIKSEWKTLIDEGITRLTTPTGAMKVIWNACYALGKVLKNNFLFQGSDGIKWQQLIYAALNSFVVKSPNFKVRINAAAALAVPAERQNYGEHYLSTWSSLILGLDCTNNMEDFTEYKHRDNLVDQICISLAHLINLSTPDDLCNLLNIASPNIDILRMEMSRVSGRLLPEQSGKLITACMHMQMFLMENKMSVEQRNAAHVIISIFSV